jgi:hypothetical protein
VAFAEAKAEAASSRLEARKTLSPSLPSPFLCSLLLLLLLWWW